jgi:hypothetical protein
MFRKTLFILWMILSITACMSPSKIVNDTTLDRIYFGKSGGFTNIPMDYVLIDHSRVFKIEKDKYSAVNKLNNNQAKELDQLIQSLDIDKLELNEPGNITYYIKMVKSGVEKEIKWNDQSMNNDVKDTYKALLATINK